MCSMLTIDEVAQLGAQLPMLVRGIYYEGWDPSNKPLRGRHKRDFMPTELKELWLPGFSPHA